MIVRFITLLTTALAAGTLPVMSLSLSLLQGSVANTPIAPKQDPWYSAPDGFEAARPGQVLRIRPAPGNLTQVVGNCSAAYNLLYRTTDSNDNPTWAVTTLFVPKHPSLGRPLLSYQMPYDSANLDDSPSFTLLNNPPEDIATALGRNWYVNVPDFEGPSASFAAGVISGHATLDSVRAVRSSCLGIARDVRVALWGYSGGALGSEWAAELQASYAPDIALSGVALGGLTPNATSVFFADSGDQFAAIGAEGVVGLTSQHPAARATLLSALKTTGPYNRESFLSVQNITLNQALSDFAFKDMTLYFKDGANFFRLPAIHEAFRADGIMGRHGLPQMPVYVYKAISDEQSPIADTDKLVEEYCSKGVSIIYDRNTVGGHIAEATNGRPAAIQFLISVLEQDYYRPAGCEIRNVTVSLDTSPLR